MGGTLFRKKETTMPRNPFRRFSSKHATSHPTTAQPTLASTQASAHESREARDTKQRRGNSEELLISSVEGVTIESGAPVSADNSTPANGPDQYETHMSLRERQAPAVETPVYQQKPLPHIGSGSPPALSVSRKHDSADNQPVRRWSKAREHILLEQMSSSSPPASRAAKPPQSSNRAISLKDGLVLQTSVYHDRAPVRRRSRAAQQILQEMGRATTPSPSDQSTESSVEIDTTLSSGSDSGLQKKHSLSPAAADFVYELPVAYSAKLNRRKALLIGIGYQNHKFLHPLPGCKNDVTTMFNLLTSELYAFPQDSIRVLSDELTALGTSHVDAPTRFNILRDMFWLTEDVSEGDSVVFFFAGHGDFIDDVSGDEIETGVDQCIMPIDCLPEPKHRTGRTFKGVPPILDDTIYERLVRGVPAGAKVTAIVDACRSGSVCDLPVMHVDDGVKYRASGSDPPRQRRSPHMAAGSFVLFSGSADHQQSVDMTIAKQGGDGEVESFGVMTKSFVDAMSEMSKSRCPDNYDGVESWTYGQLFWRVKELVFERASTVLPQYIEKQEPQMSTSHKFDIWTTPFSI